MEILCAQCDSTGGETGRCSRENGRFSIHAATQGSQGAGTTFADSDRPAMERFLGIAIAAAIPSKTSIIRPGDSANILYFVIEGSLTVSSEDEEGRELILAYINRGEFIGEMGLFVETPRREVMVRTRTPCDLAEIGYERLFQSVRGSVARGMPKVLFAIGSQLTNRLLHTTRKVSRLAFMDVTSRVAKTLIDLTERTRRDDRIPTARRFASRARKSVVSSVARAKWSGASSSSSKSRA